MHPKPILLIILDGWGYREDTHANAIALANTPCWDQLWEKQPHTLLSGCGKDVGLPQGQMGNSEVGHITLGSGRIIYQDLSAINQSIQTGEFFNNKVLRHAIQDAKSHKLHILGMLSPGGVHSHEAHILALLDLAKACQKTQVYFHLFLDGRDTPPQSAKNSLCRLQQHIKTLNLGSIATIMGRYYAMDRDKRYDRTEQAYNTLTQGQAPYHAVDAIQALSNAYARRENDEFVQPTVIDSHGLIESGDSVIFANFRADRARQLTDAFVNDNFTGFTRNKHPKLKHFVSLTEYAKDLKTEIAFPKEQPLHSLGEILAKNNKKQLRIAETEKYAHVTFFFNGGREQPFEGEDRILIPSPKVTTYDLLPAMSAMEVTDKLIEAIHNKAYDMIICNFANADMVGHTGKLDATIKAIETLDHCLAKICEALKQCNGEALITADHGNAELMFNEQSKQPHTAHTHQEVPLVYIGQRKLHFIDKGGLKDVAPSLLAMLGMSAPQEMTGQSLIHFDE